MSHRRDDLPPGSAERLGSFDLSATGPDRPAEATPTGTTPAAVEVAPGLRVGRYEFEEEIARGGMGAVWRARDTDLGRALAVKLLLEKGRGRAELERRFRAEAQVTGQLQHPGIPPVHEVGILPDGRPFFAMKLIKGRTLADLLAERPSPADDRPRFLGIFSQVCQTLAYAHSRGVIHRDLKPSNVMVGAFGEVQVMDWGLAKVLGEAPAAAAEPADTSTIATVRTGGEGPSSQDGAVLGTPAYMAPEQARGEIDRLDERCDVFGLGALLCVILTGAPPYGRGSRGEVLARAARGDLGDVLARLEASVADAELIDLALRCLAAERDARPRHAGEVAQAVAAYLDGVQERLREAERQRAAAEARAEGERRARRLLLGLAAAVLLLVLLGGGGAWLVQQHRQRTEQEARLTLERGHGLLQAGWEANDLEKLREALAEAERAAAVARSGGAGAAVQQEADAFRDEAAERLRRATRDQELRTALLDVAAPHETRASVAGSSGAAVALAEPSVDEQFRAAFRRWGLDVDETAEADVVARLREEPAAVVQQVVAGLDGWMLARRRLKRPEAEWRRLFRLAEQLDPSPRHRGLRALLVGEAAPPAAEVAGLLGGWPPWPAVWELARGARWRRLRELRDRVDPATEPVLTVVLLQQASAALGDPAGAEQLLRRALAARPGELVLLNGLGELLERQGPARQKEAIAYYRAARALRPNLGVALARALGRGGQASEGELVLGDLVCRQPDNPEVYFYLGRARYAQRKLAEAAAAFHKAIELNPEYAAAYNDLGTTLNAQGKLPEAAIAFRRALALRPDFATSYTNLGIVLGHQGKWAEAEAACRQAIASRSDYALAHEVLGTALQHQGKLPEAAAAFRRALALQPESASAYGNLGLALREQGKLAEALAACHKAIALQPDNAEGYEALGLVLDDQRKLSEAVAAYHKALELQPDYAEASINLGITLGKQGRLSEAEAAIRKALALEPDLAEGYTNLGIVLEKQGKLSEAVAAHHKALELQPRDANTYVNLGAALNAQGKLPEAEASFRQALKLRPDHATAYTNLGVVLRRQGKLSEAVAACRKAIELQPDDVPAYEALAFALDDQRKLPEAAAAFRKAIALQPDYAPASYGLGNVLRKQGKLPEAVAAYHRAIDWKPDYVKAYVNLGLTLDQQGKQPEAVAAIRKAIDLRPDFAQAHFNLGNILLEQGKLSEAAVAYRKTISLQPDYAEAHCNLGHVLRAQGKFAEAVASLKRGHELGSRRSNWAYPSAAWVRRAERLLELDSRLPKVLSGEIRPADAAERVELAGLCQMPCKQLYAAAARFYRDAFAADPKRAADPGSWRRYNAACCAALAGCGRGKEADRLDEKERGRWRQQARDWLHADLAAWAKALDTGKAPARAEVQQTLRHWQTDADLADVRDPDALAKLPEAERRPWRQLWADVGALLAKASAAK
jgi:tetratricopeptide (TPR) repeat protein